MGMLTWAAAGILGAILGRFAVKGARRAGVLADLAVCIAGALIGGGIMSWFGHLSIWTVNVPSVLVAFVGSIIALLIARTFMPSKTAA